MIVIIYVKMLTTVTDKAGDDALKKVEVTAILAVPAMPPTEACLPLRIKEDKPTRPDLLRSRAVLRTERRGRVKERRGARQDAAHAVATDGRHQPGLLLYLRCSCVALPPSRPGPPWRLSPPQRRQRSPGTTGAGHRYFPLPPWPPSRRPTGAECAT